MQTPEDRQRADELFRTGNKLYAEGKWAEAEAAFRAAWEINPSHDVAANLGHTEYKLGKYRDAAEYLSFALRNSPLVGKQEPRELAKKRLDEVRAQVGTLHVQVSVTGATVLVDGKPVGQAPLDREVFVDPGKRMIEARLPGYEPARQSVDIAKGGELDVALAMKATPPLPRRSVVPGAVLGGVAGVALVSGIGVYVAARSKRASAESVSQSILQEHHSCVAGAHNLDTRCAELLSTASTGNTFQHVSAGLFVGAGVAAAGALVYFVWPQATPTAPRTGTWRIMPAVSPTALGLTASGTF
jgi:hypothetical protein